MSLPIEPGCLARVVSSRAENRGKVVRVYGRNLHKRQPDATPILIDETIWNISEAVAWYYHSDNRFAGHYPTAPESCLQRIDDDSRQITSWESMKDIWVPKEAIA